ncbi:MAG: putative peptide zinc metalloprotease protein [Pseudohongiellaceae bacterium]|jgi:putative peptide zinc metalloprotease protein
MSGSTFSAHWYRAAKLRPRLHGHISINRQQYRGLIWYVLEDGSTDRHHRFNSAAYQFIGLLDGQRSVDEIFTQLERQLGDFSPSQDEIIQLLSTLYTADLLQADIKVDTEELFERQANQQNSRFKQRLANPVSLKIPLWDPDDFLNKHFNKVRWLFSGWVALAWIVLIGIASIQTAQHWQQISQHFSLNTLSPYNLILLFLLYPPIKIVHELGHAFAAKLEGGEVHEMGVNFMLFVPIPYVNVSTSVRFRSKYKRMLVSAAGILVESFLAALGLLLFLAAEPGIIQSIGFNVFMIGGISSLFFNGNPLLKYDAYYILSDAAAIPNLYQRASHYWRYLLQRYLLGLKDANSPVYAAGEAYWFVTYGLLSLVYRLAVVCFIIVIVSEKVLIAGVLLGIWLLGQQFVIPLLKALYFVINLARNSCIGEQRYRLLTATIGVTVLLVGVIGFVPLPSYTLTQGVLWQPDEAQLVAPENGFLSKPLVSHQQHVNAGDPILQLDDPFLPFELRLAASRVKELQSKYRAKRTSNLVAAGIIKEELRISQSQLQHTLNKINTMTVTTAKSGRVVLPQADDLAGRYVHKGELLGYLVDGQMTTVRMVVKQAHIGQLRQRIDSIEVKFASHPGRTFTASILRQAPEAVNQLPSAALSTAGGGPFITDPSAEDGRVISENVFLVDLTLAGTDNTIALGTRAYIRIDHGGEALVTQLYRRFRQVFLRQFNV